MRVEGSQTIQGLAPAVVYERLTDPAVLRLCTPGMKSLEVEAEGRYRVLLEVGVAAVKGRYEGTFEVLAAQPPDGFTLAIDLAGQSGFVRAQVPVALRAVAAGTELSYAGDAQVGGPVAGVGQRVLGGVAKWLVSQFFNAMAREAGASRNGGGDQG